MATETETRSSATSTGGGPSPFVETGPGLPPLYRLSVDQYHRMIEAGIIHSGAPVELIEGLLVRKLSKIPPHIVCCDLLRHWLHLHVPAGWFVSSENPLTLADVRSEPEPDAKIIRGSPRDYLDAKPGPADAALIIEVSYSSYRYDRHVKWGNYAASGVPVYWILDLNRRALEIHTDPGPDGYASCLILGPDDDAPILLDGREVARLRVAEILP